MFRTILFRQKQKTNEQYVNITRTYVCAVTEILVAEAYLLSSLIYRTFEDNINEILFFFIID